MKQLAGRSGPAQMIAVGVVVASFSLVGCGDGDSAADAGAPSTRAAQQVTVTDEQVRELCEQPTATSSARPLPGPADRLVPDGGSALVVCAPGNVFDSDDGREEARGFVTTDLEKTAAVVAALNALPPESADVMCTLRGGGEFTTVVVGPQGGGVRITLDTANECASATNGRATRTGADQALALIEKLVKDPDTRTVKLTNS